MVSRGSLGVLRASWEWLWGVLEGGWCVLEVLGGSSEVLGWSMDVHQEVFLGHCESLGVLGGVLGRSQGSLEAAWEASKTDEVFSERLGRVLWGFWGGFGALGWSLGRSWEVKM